MPVPSPSPSPSPELRAAVVVLAAHLRPALPELHIAHQDAEHAASSTSSPPPVSASEL